VRAGQRTGLEQRWFPSTALDDLLEIEKGKINDTRQYRCLDRILPPETKLEPHLKKPYGALFGAEFDVLLYGLSSTYVRRRGCGEVFTASEPLSASSITFWPGTEAGENVPSAQRVCVQRGSTHTLST
jgi:hypothetical protein